MTGKMQELSDDHLRKIAMSAADRADPHRLHKEQSHRELESILRVIRPVPDEGGIDATTAKIAGLKKRFVEAEAAHLKIHPRNSSSTEQRASQALLNAIAGELYFAKRRLKDLEAAEASRAARAEATG